MYLANTGSQLYLGGADKDLYEGELEFHDAKYNAGTWRISGASLALEGVPVVQGFETIISASASVIWGPPESVKALQAQVPGSALTDPQSGVYMYPCNSTVNVSFSWGGQEWKVSPKK